MAWTGDRRGRRGSGWAVVAASAVAVLAMSGCTGEDEADPAPDGASGSSSASEGSGDGPSSAELSRDLLAAQPPTEILGSVTAPVAKLRGAEVVLDVLELERTESGVRTTFRVSTSVDNVSISPLTFGGGRSTSQFFLHDVLLEDADVSATRYRPLRFEDYRQACVCPLLPLEIGAGPRTVSALFPPLPPGVDRVTLVLGDSALSVPDLPVAAAS